MRDPPRGGGRRDVVEAGRGKFEECGVFANTLTGVEVSEGGDPSFRQCQIHDGKQGGVVVHTEGRGRFDQCGIFADVRVGMAMWEGDDPVVRRSKIHDNKQSGVMMLNGGRGTLHDCEFWGAQGQEPRRQERLPASPPRHCRRITAPAVRDSRLANCGSERIGIL
ncbi:MAG: right-handed parallel beta-helix repeat-containing protein [Bryobacteraceae bacterium]